MSANFSQEDFLALPPERQLELLPLLEELAARGHRARAKDDFYYFCQSVYPGYVKGTHLKLVDGSKTALGGSVMNLGVGKEG